MWADMGYRILFFDPNAAWGEALKQKISAMDCKVVWCSEEAQAIEQLHGVEVDVAVVCLTPDGTGLDILDQRRVAAGSIPVLIATHADDIVTRIAGLNRGAVDYLVSPFDADELLARVSTVMVRRETPSERFVRRGKIILDREAGRVGDGSNWTALSPWEMKVFSLLFGGGDRPVSKQHLKSVLADKWCMTDNAIEVGIHRLRLKARAWGMRIQTYGRAGYVLQDF